MANWTDFIFGKKTLKKASGESDTPEQPKSPPANLDISKMAQDQANQLQGTGPSEPEDKKKKKQTGGKP